MINSFRTKVRERVKNLINIVGLSLLFTYLLALIDFILLEIYPFTNFFRKILLEQFKFTESKSLTLYHVLLFLAYYIFLYIALKKLYKSDKRKRLKIFSYVFIFHFLFGLEDVFYYINYLLLFKTLPDVCFSGMFWLNLSIYGLPFYIMFGKVTIYNLILTSGLGIVIISTLEYFLNIL